jgi:hypothetical protein
MELIQSCLNSVRETHLSPATFLDFVYSDINSVNTFHSHKLIPLLLGLYFSTGFLVQQNAINMNS